MNEEVRKELEQEELTPFHEQLLQHCKKLVDHSRSVMSKHYTDWDKRDEVYRAVRQMDRKDRDSAKNNEPVKMTVPLTTAQVNTFIAFAFMVLHQRRRLFEFKSTGPEDHELRESLEQLIEADLNYNKFQLHEYQFWLDVARFGVGIFKHGWAKEVSRVMVDNVGTLVGGEQSDVGESYQDFVKFEGNRIGTVSPYSFFPDVRLPLTRFQEGEFCACEDEHTRVALRKMEADGDVAGIQHVQEFDGDSLNTRTEQSRFNNINLDNPDNAKNLVCVTECQVRLVPKDFEVEGKHPLGTETRPIMYLVWYANDQRVIKAEPMTTYHDSFSYEVAQMTPDQHHRLNQSLSEIVSKLQSTVDWFINSRVSSVKRTLDNQLIVDPGVVEMSSLENRSRVIRLKRGVARAGLDRYIKPLPVQDVTGRHLDDAAILVNFAQASTGVNDNALGQYNSGRRSATEARAVTQGSASRLMTTIGLIWTSAYQPLGQKLTLNQRQYLSEERFAKVLGQIENGPELFQQFKADPATLIGNVDHFVHDGTLPSEKQFLAQSLQEVLGLILSNPEAAAQFAIDPKKLLEEIYVLRGVDDMERFKQEQPAVDPAMLQQILAQAQAAAQGGAPQPQPGQVNV